MGDEPAEFQKVNLRDLEEVGWEKEGRRGFGKMISEALGRKPDSTDLMERHPIRRRGIACAAQGDAISVPFT